MTVVAKSSRHEYNNRLAIKLLSDYSKIVLSDVSFDLSLSISTKNNGNLPGAVVPPAGLQCDERKNS